MPAPRVQQACRCYQDSAAAGATTWTSHRVPSSQVIGLLASPLAPWVTALLSLQPTQAVVVLVVLVGQVLWASSVLLADPAPASSWQLIPSI